MALLCIGLVVILFLLSDASESGISLVPSINCSGSNATVGGSFSVFCTYSLGSKFPCGYDLPYIEVQVPNKATVRAAFNRYNTTVEEPLCCIHGPVSIDGGKQCKFNLTSGGNINGSYNMTIFLFTVNKGQGDSNEVDRRITLYIFNQSDHSGPPTPPGPPGPPPSGTTPGPSPSETPGPLVGLLGLLCIPAAILFAKVIGYIIYKCCKNCPHRKAQGKGQEQSTGNGQEQPVSKTMSSKDMPSNNEDYDKPDGGIVLKSYIRRRPHN
jgi:hypothetical protein